MSNHHDHPDSLAERLRDELDRLAEEAPKPQSPLPLRMLRAARRRGRRRRAVRTVTPLLAAAAGAAVIVFGGSDPGPQVVTTPGPDPATTVPAATSSTTPTTIPRAELLGDPERVLDLVRSSTDAWQQVEGTVILDTPPGPPVDFAVSKSGAYSIASGGSVSVKTADGLTVSVIPETRRAMVSSSLPSSRREVPGTDDPLHPLPGEQPTNNGLLNKIVTPAYWFRGSVDALDPIVTVTGEDRVAGRDAIVLQLVFPPSTREKWAPEGWTLWVDAERGLLLRSALPLVGGAPHTFEVDEIRIDRGEPSLVPPVVPAGYTAQVLVDRGSEQPPIMSTLVVEADTPARELVEQVQRGG